MAIEQCRTLITGATGGIGSHLAMALAKQGVRLMLVGRREAALRELQQQITLQTGTMPLFYAADLTDSDQRQGLMNYIHQTLGGIDLLINNAGIVEFTEFAEQEPAMIERIFRTNLTAPVLLTQAVLPTMLEQQSGTVVNIGSIFGSIGFAYFSTYSSSKFALRGFSESLRRELKGSGIKVLYIAPRATRTDANSTAVYEMAKATKMQMDPPEKVAQQIVQAILRGKANAYLGFPEGLFVRINSLFPSLADWALRKQNQIMATFATKG